MTVTWKKLAYRADVLPDLLSPYAVGDLLYADSTTTLAKLADVAVGSYLASGGIGVVPAWATLNQAAVAGLATTDGPSFAHLHLADVAAIYTAAESWIGPSSTTGIYFKGGWVGIGTIPSYPLHISRSDMPGYPTAPDYTAVFSNAGGNREIAIGLDTTGEPTIQARIASTLAARQLSINPLGGNVGIGTASPLYKLDVAGAIHMLGDDVSVAMYFNTGLALFRSRTAVATDIGYIDFPQLNFRDNSNGYASQFMIKNGNVGIGTTSPTNLLSLGGNAARIFWMERHTTAENAGNSLTVQAGGATVAGTNKAGGQLILLPGLSTGSAESGVTIQGCVAGGAGTGDNSPQDMIKVLGNKLGVFNTTPVVQQNHIADASGGATVDAEARAAINAALLVLETYGFLKAA